MQGMTINAKHPTVQWDAWYIGEACRCLVRCGGIKPRRSLL